MNGGGGIEQARQQHGEFQDYLTLLQSVPKLVTDPRSLSRELPRARGFLGRVLPRHFRQEEDIVFPAVLEQAPPELRPRLEAAVAQLRREHDLLLDQALALLDGLARLSQYASLSDLLKLNARVQAFGDALRRNSQREDEEIFPHLLQFS